MENIQDEKRFNKIYGFICVFGALTLALITAIVFRPIPKDNVQSANMALAFCMSAFTGLMGYLIGASPKDKGNAPLPAGTRQESVTMTNTETPADKTTVA